MMEIPAEFGMGTTLFQVPAGNLSPGGKLTSETFMILKKSIFGTGRTAVLIF